MVRDKVVKRKTDHSGKEGNSGQRVSKMQRREEVLPVLPTLKGDIHGQHDTKDVTHLHTDVCSRDILKDDVTNLHTDREIIHMTQFDRHDHGQIADEIFQSDKSLHQATEAKPRLSTIIFRG